jgi:putative endonuclease
MDKNYFVYILASRSRVLYTGVTNNVMRRVMEHRQGHAGGFTSKYRIHRLLHVETFAEINAAIRREKEIKSWRREKREALIEAHNPTWVDLLGEWVPPYPREKQIPRPKTGLGMTEKRNSGEGAPR